LRAKRAREPAHQASQIDHPGAISLEKATLAEAEFFARLAAVGPA
jgi:hypothetical protein